MARKKLLYPYAEELTRRPAHTGRAFDIGEPDIIETAAGFCPNYDKLEAHGFTTEQALIWCNMD